VQANLDSRYHVSPSVLYAICHVSRDGSAYKVPLDADWVTIAVVCDATHRTSQGKEYERSEWDSDDEERQLQRELSGQAPDPERAKKRKRTAVGRKGKSFTIFKLTTVPSRASGLEAGGDAMVNLLLYEADSVRQGPDGKVHYKGGSGGAWEEWHSKLSVGSVIAVMNPKVIKPYGVSVSGRVRRTDMCRLMTGRRYRKAIRPHIRLATRLA
jgi:minichromosome maintenance protein 10